MLQSFNPADKTGQLTERDIEELQEEQSLKSTLLNKPKEFILKALLNRLYPFIYIADTLPPETDSENKKQNFAKKNRKTLIHTLILAEEQSREMYKSAIQALKNDTE